MTQIKQKLADSKDSLRSQSHRAGAVPCKKTGDAAGVLDCLGAQEREASTAFMQYPTVKFHTANSQSPAAG